jgi:ADP-L-glycero-D-manno-heptose 6-epimerase
VLSPAVHPKMPCDLAIFAAQNLERMIVVTGAAGFIGSCMVSKLNSEGFNNIVVVDDFSKEAKKGNLEGKSIGEFVDRNVFDNWLKKNHKHVECIFHLGARTDTTEFSVALFNELNLDYTKRVWNACVEYAIPLIYASSAATYGLGEHGYDDNHEVIGKLKPLNPYGDSKNDFDKWALAQEKKPMYWVGIKFFNVYGPNEYHKGRMASVVWHTFNQIKQNGGMKLFQSHKPEYKDGEQMRDFVYVKDVVDVLLYHMLNRTQSGIYNLGSGKARSFLDLAKATFRAMQLEPTISFIPTPEDIRDKYQYFTEANMAKTFEKGYPKAFHTLEDGVADYVQNHLMKEQYY